MKINTTHFDNLKHKFVSHKNDHVLYGHK